MEIIEYSAKAIAVVGDTKPHKKELKQLGGSFNPRLTCGAGWIFPATKRQAVEDFVKNGKLTANKATQSHENTKIGKCAAEEEKAVLEAYFAANNSSDYDRKTTSAVCVLTNGDYVAFDKQTIATDFCFGYSTDTTGDDHKRATDCADNARTNEQYFLNENLSTFDRQIKQMETLRNGYDEPLRLFVYGKPTDRSFVLLTLGQVDNKRGWYDNMAEVGDADRQIILSALKQEREKFNKRLQTYLKKYGLSKLHVWTYWRDA